MPAMLMITCSAENGLHDKDDTQHRFGEGNWPDARYARFNIRAIGAARWRNEKPPH